MRKKYYNSYEPLSKRVFPPDFMWGVGDSAYQTEGHQGAQAFNNWFNWENIRVGSSCERWTRYPEDIQRIKQAGFSYYRFSVEWSKIEPLPTQFDEYVLRHYALVCEELIRNAITPVITLFHHTWPQWFDQLGAFEYKENIPYFVRFAEFVYSTLHRYTPYWIILNEPEGYAIQGYFQGVYPPGKKSLALAGKVLYNMLQAHMQTYTALKKINPAPALGIAKIYHPINPYYAWHPLEKIVSALFDNLFNTCILDYFTTGTFKWGIGPFCRLSYIDAQAPHTLDFIGINYYSHARLKFCAFSFSPFITATRPYIRTTDTGQEVYPMGLYQAITAAAHLNKPIIITENGVADAHNACRQDYLRQHLAVVETALHTGYNVRGYFYWSLTDNFEWCHGYAHKFGLYAVDFTTQERTLRPSAYEFVQFLQKQVHYKNSMQNT